MPRPTPRRTRSEPPSRPNLSRRAQRSGRVPDPRMAALGRPSPRDRQPAGAEGGIEPPCGHLGPDDVRRYAEAVYGAHGPRLHGWLIGMTRDEATAEDLTHEAFVRLLREAAAGRA